MSTFVQNVDVETLREKRVFNLVVIVEAPNAATAPAVAQQILEVTQPNLRIVKFGTTAQVTTS